MNNLADIKSAGGVALRVRTQALQFRSSVLTSDAGLLAYRELDDAFGLSDLAGENLADARTGKNGRHALVGMLRQAVFGRLAGYEDVNDAERLRHDPAMRWVVGGKAAHGSAASASQMGRFETRWLTAAKNLSALADLSGQWIDKVHGRRPPRGVVLDMDSSVSPNSWRAGDERLERPFRMHLLSTWLRRASVPSADGPAVVRRTVRACQERDAVAGWTLTGSNQADVGLEPSEASFR